MSISYPVPSSGGGGTTIVSQRSQYAIPATVGITFPIIVSGSTSPVSIGDIFAPPSYFYQTSGSYYISVLGYITGTSGVTGSLEIQVGPSPSYAYLTENAPFGSPGAMASRFSSSSGITEVDFNGVPLTGAPVPISFSGSVTDYTASIYGIYFSPTA